MRRALERITLPDRVVGIAVQVDAVGPPSVRQGDLFDLGFASAHAAENAVAHVLDLQGDAVVAMQRHAHPLLERRAHWVADELAAENRGTTTITQTTRDAALQPQLLPVPREVGVITQQRRGFAVPVRYTEYPEMGHASWDAAYADPDLARWMFAQRQRERPPLLQ